jgi:hypothetical protein
MSIAPASQVYFVVIQVLVFGLVKPVVGKVVIV